MRLAAVQASPMLRSLASMAPWTALSRSASSNTSNGALPPSSIEVRRTFCAASSMRRRPTEVEPVNDSLRSEEHTSELQSRGHLVCRLLLEKKKRDKKYHRT